MAPVKSFWLLMPLLLLRLIPTAAAHPTILNATDIRANSRTSNVTEAIAWWEKHHAHLPGYFDDIADNFNVSGALKWYKPWIVAKAKEFPKEYENLGEITFFAVKVMGLGTTFKCATLHRGCDGKPTTEAIIEFFMSNDTLSRQEAMEMSRKVNFIFTRTNSAVLQNTATHHHLEVAESSLKTRIPNLVKAYTPSLSREAQINCQLYKFGIDMFFEVYKTLLSTAASAADTAMGSPISTGGLYTLPVTAIPKSLQLTEDIHKIEKSSKKNSVDMGDGFELRMDNGYVEGVCNEIDETATRRDQMEAHIGKLFRALKGINEATMQTSLNGEPTNIKRGVSYLANLIGRSTLNRGIDQMSDSFSAYERGFAQLYEELYISYALANSQCYVKGSVIHNETTYNRLCHPTAKEKWWNQESRLCDDETKTVVQAQCVTSAKSDNREIQLLGINALKESNLNLTQVLSDSLTNYCIYGAKGIQPRDIAASDPLWQDILMNRNVSLVNLPVCFSNLIYITNFDGSKSSGGHKALNQHIPSTCGSEASNETEIFRDRVGMGYNQTHFLNGDMEELVETIQPETLRNLDPCARYKAFCALGTQLPNTTSGELNHGEQLKEMHRFRWQRGKSQYCDAIKNETQGMTPRTATRYFCTDSETARKIFAEERNYADSLVPFMESHARLCGDWLPALYGFDEPDVGLWDDKYGNMKLPKDIFHVDYSQYHKGEKNATKEES